LVRFIAGDADFAVPRVDDLRDPDADVRAPDPDDLRAPEADDLRAPEEDLRPADDEEARFVAPEAFLAAPPAERFALAPLFVVPLPELPPVPERLFASIALRAGDARSDLAYATS
jgi:hypothetical protein